MNSGDAGSALSLFTRTVAASGGRSDAQRQASETRRGERGREGEAQRNRARAQSDAGDAASTPAPLPTRNSRSSDRCMLLFRLILLLLPPIPRHERCVRVVERTHIGMLLGTAGEK